jgi:hypothetical protein
MLPHFPLQSLSLSVFWVLQQVFFKDFLEISFLQQHFSLFDPHAKVTLGAKAKPSIKISNM